MRHPETNDEMTYMQTPEWQRSSNPTTLGASKAMREYLVNRLTTAFRAGWEAAERRVLASLKEKE